MIVDIRLPFFRFCFWAYSTGAMIESQKQAEASAVLDKSDPLLIRNLWLLAWRITLLLAKWGCFSHEVLFFSGKEEDERTNKSTTLTG